MKLVFGLYSLAIAGVLLEISQTQAATIIEYRFDESGPVATNSGTLGTAGNGVLNNVSRFPDNHPFAIGSCVDFNGVNSFIRVANNFGYGDRLTIEAWIKPTLITEQRIIWDDYGNPGVLLAVKNGSVQFGVSTPTHPGGGIGIVSGTLATNVWQHVAGVYDGQVIRIYVNGWQAPDTAATSGNIIENNADPAIGSDNISTTALNFAGRMDDFRIHTHALSADELANGAFVRLQLTTVANQAVLWWRTNAIGFQLEATTNLVSGTWQSVLPAPTLVTSNLFVTNSLASTSKFYRLKSP